jgi:hypothetical protein
MFHREQRKARRFLIQLPAIVRWTDGKIGGEAKTETKDVSSHGLRFDLSEALESGTSLEILMTLSHEVTRAGPVRVRCRGSVVRTSLNNSDKIEVVATIQKFVFIRGDENAL